MRMKKQTRDLIVKAPGRNSKVEMTIRIDLGDALSHYCTLSQEGEVVGAGFALPHLGSRSGSPICRRYGSAMDAGTHSIWISQPIQEMGHEVIVANVRELRAISHSDRKRDDDERD
jgi:transposase